MKKGFTLIELLAVIVILAILALVAIPVVGNVIDSGRESAIENSVTFYVKELESKFSEWTIEGMPDGLVYTTTEKGYIQMDVENLDEVLKLEGERPIKGFVEIDNDYSSSNSFFGYVINAELEYDNGYIATYTYHTDDDYEGTRVEIEINQK